MEPITPPNQDSSVVWARNPSAAFANVSIISNFRFMLTVIRAI